MINLYKQGDGRTKSKTMLTANKSHIASMNLKIATDSYSDFTQREPLRNSTNRPYEDDPKSRSGHKYKKSLILQETTIQLVKKNSQYCPPKGKEMGMSTERFGKDKPQKRSVDYGLVRMKTEADEGRGHQQKGIERNTVEVNADELRDMLMKLKQLRSEKQNLNRQLNLFRREVKKNGPNNSVLRALAL